MKYLLVGLLLIASIYPLSYAKYEWDKKNKFPAIGSILLVAASLVISIMQMWK